MQMKIAILGWGSLIWDKRDLPIVGEWQEGGPVLRIEFSRISSDGRLTLVIDEQNGADVMTRYARSAYDNLNDAIASLREREGTTKERIGFVNLVSHAERDWSRQQHPGACDGIKVWAQVHSWEAVIWTALISNFAEKCGQPFSATAAFRYFNSLAGETKARAMEYIQNAPPKVDTPFRRLALAPANAHRAPPT
jgi:hypothetical protein